MDTKCIKTLAKISFFFKHKSFGQFLFFLRILLVLIFIFAFVFPFVSIFWFLVIVSFVRILSVVTIRLIVGSVTSVGIHSVASVWFFVVVITSAIFRVIRFVVVIVPIMILGWLTGIVLPISILRLLVMIMRGRIRIGFIFLFVWFLGRFWFLVMRFFIVIVWLLVGIASVGWFFVRVIAIVRIVSVGWLFVRVITIVRIVRIVTAISAIPSLLQIMTNSIDNERSMWSVRSPSLGRFEL